MGFLHLDGSAVNHILSATVTGSSEDANFPWSNLTKTHQYEIGRMSAAGADDTIEADLGSSKSATIASVHFHNIDDARAVTLERDDNAGFASPTLVATFTKQSPSFHATFDSASDRYWRIKIAGTNSVPIYVGAWALGLHGSLTRIQRNDWTLRYVMDQARDGLAIVNQSLFARRAVELEFGHYSEAQKDEILDMLKDSKWGEEPLVIVPDDSDPTIVMWAVAPADWEVVRSKPRQVAGGDALGSWDHSVVLEEEPFPIIVK